MYYSKFRIPKINSAAEMGNRKMMDENKNINTDLQILTSALDTLFTNSHTYSDEQLLVLLDALNQITLDFLEKISMKEHVQQ